METEAPIIVPVAGKHPPDVGPMAVIVSNDGDLSALSGRLPVAAAFKHLMMSRIHLDTETPARFSVSGPVIGAPYAVMVLEPLITWGATDIFYLGWCGAVSPDVRVGDLLVATGALVDEGTSPHYGAAPQDMVKPSLSATEALRRLLSARNLSCICGPVWSTDAVYRETPSKVRHHQDKGILAVEMEASAIFTVARHRGVRAAALLVVSDSLSDFTWRPGFRNPRFLESRTAAVEIMKNLCLQPRIP